MTSPTLKELKYRTFDDLINEVYMDFSSFSREGMVEPGQLIKIAQKCNYELGLKLNKTKETILEIEHGRAKLPSDFYILNLALLCGRYQTCEPSAFSGLHTEDVATPIPLPEGPTLTTCPCWTVISNGAQCPVKYCDGTEAIVYFPPNDDSSPKTTKICALLVDAASAQGGTMTAATHTFCYNYPNSGYSCEVPDTCCVTHQPVDTCGTIPPDPFNRNRVYTTCNNTMQVNVIEYRSNEVRQYSDFEMLHMKPSKEASAFCVNTNFRTAAHTGFIRDGYIWVPTLRDAHHFTSHKVYICYLGNMEDDNGNLLVLDHPKINEYYEYALKERILQNLYLNGEPDLERRLSLIKEELKIARRDALTIAATPDFYELKQTIEMNRKAMYHKYLHPFSSLYANTPGWPWSFNNELI